jgi:hypothetical protein
VAANKDEELLARMAASFNSCSYDCCCLKELGTARLAMLRACVKISLVVVFPSELETFV